ELHRQVPGPHRRPRRVQVADAANRSGLVGSHGSDAGRSLADAGPLRPLGEENRQLHRLQRHQVRRQPMAGNRIRTALAGGLVAAVCITATACGAGPGQQAAGTISYWLWDSAQQPGYQRCADKFHAQNPDLNVEITQYGFDDYWSKLTSGF